MKIRICSNWNIRNQNKVKKKEKWINRNSNGIEVREMYIFSHEMKINLVSSSHLELNLLIFSWSETFCLIHYWLKLKTEFYKLQIKSFSEGRRITCVFAFIWNDQNEQIQRQNKNEEDWEQNLNKKILMRKKK